MKADTIESHVYGIPCLIRIDDFVYQKPMGQRANSDVDCYGYVEINFTV